MIHRDLSPLLEASASRFPVVTLTGPRQSGKSTLCRGLFGHLGYVSLEAPDTRDFARNDPRAFLGQFEAGAVLDEIQRAPELVSYLQGIVDDDPTPGRWVLTGSQNLALLETVGQSLAGRTSIHHLLPLSRGEVVRFVQHPTTLEEAIWSGGYPRIFDRGLDPGEWLASYVATYVERDVRSISNVTDLVAFQRFIELCAGRVGQIVNDQAIASDCGISQPTAKSWRSVLEASFVSFRLPAFHRSHRKRLVKSPKLHFYDSGLACWLLGIREPGHLRSHPLRGALFECWVVTEVLKARSNRGEQRGLSFYRDRDAVEADLLVERVGGGVVVEIKSSATPNSHLFDGVRRVRELLAGDENVWDGRVVYGGEAEQTRSAGELVPWSRVHEFDW
ncbi:hypothetical protein Pla163_04580 [Planctomycetes bacterium Pla163]|uniref:ATP-binding protein n=1 Tax=Rohdeia mirabilis TaxID=2528008 RepID=A0A518CVV7_9BACT|nr:hypothetical protein Pla163_04580 [Planctomycetes bacterium Pla163]